MSEDLVCMCSVPNCLKQVSPHTQSPDYDAIKLDGPNITLFNERKMIYIFQFACLLPVSSPTVHLPLDRTILSLLFLLSTWIPSMPKLNNGRGLWFGQHRWQLSSSPLRDHIFTNVRRKGPLVSTLTRASNSPHLQWIRRTRTRAIS